MIRFVPGRSAVLLTPVTDYGGEGEIQSRGGKTSFAGERQ